ncbi:hypothetical protein PHMEG_00028833 [Phytophthora megakarya]|uniref:Uncharacterized protein n=1 Tax=Phytophthora megakarya TaxID=4795 RepID=A0A225V6L2_9STRA|nr:hypothetical protein PHMEG_00028833 [Phytophthora megakarya]
MSGDDGSFGLLLEHEYTENSIRNMGLGVLKGVDNARSCAGWSKFPCYRRQKILRRDVSYADGGYRCDREGHTDSFTWYTIAGEGIGITSDVPENLNFLNPGHQTLIDI